MKKILFILSFVAIMANAYSQSEINVSGVKPKAGDIIHGVVKDSVGPMEAVTILEKNYKNEVVAREITDKNGCFSFQLVDNADFLEVSVNDLGYFSIKSQISGNHFDVFLKKYPKSLPLNSNRNLKGYDVNKKIDKNSPLLILDGSVFYNANWGDIPMTKDDYNKKEISVLFGIEANTIDRINVLKGDAAKKEWGERGKNGVIDVFTYDFENTKQSK